MANDIVVRVGAVLDRSYDAVMAEIASKSERARRNNSRQSGADMYGPGRAEFAKALAYRDKLQQASERRQLTEHERAERQKTAATLREVRTRASAEMALQRQRNSALQSQYRAEERAATTHENNLARNRAMVARRSDREIDRFASRTSHRATRFFFPPPEGALGFAKRTALDIARGAGVDFSLSAGIGKAREREAAAVQLSNQGWNPDAQAFGDRISAAELRKTAKLQAARLGLSGEDEVMTAMTKFTDVTGDLSTAKTIIGDIGLLARASGTRLDEAASAAADMSAQLPDSMDLESRRAAMQRLLGVAAMQGKRGAVEMKDLARYMPKIVSSAGAFGGRPEDNMVKLMAISQVARRYGGAPNAAVASTSVAAMVNTLKTPARVAQFKQHGVNVYDEQGKLRDIQAIIKESIVSAKNPVEFKKMWANVQGARAVEGFKTIYQKAGGGKSGLEAIDAEFKKFTAALDPAAQQKMLEASTSTTEAASNRFQQKLDEVTEKMGASLLPALERLAPTVLSLAEKFSGLLQWVADNPFKAVVVAMTAAVGRAGIESGIRMMIDRAATSLLGGGATGAGGVGGAGVGAAFAGKGAVGVAVTGLTMVAAVAAVGVAAYTTTEALLKLADASNQKSQQERAKSSNDLQREGATAIESAQDPLSQQMALSEAKRKITEADAKITGGGGLSSEAKKAIQSLEERSTAKTDRGIQQQRNAQQLASAGVGFSATQGQGISSESIAHALVQVLTGAPIMVKVNNFSDMPSMTSVNGGATSGSIWRDLSGVGG